MQVNVKQGRTRLVHRIDQRLFDTVAVAKTVRFPQVDDQVTSRISDAVAGNKVVFVIVVDRGDNDGTNGLRGSADAGRPCFFGRRNKFEPSHFGHLPC